jgi:hypothetical protein
MPKGTLKHDGGFRVLVYGGRTYAPRVGCAPLADPTYEAARLKAVAEREFIFRVLDKIHRQRGILCIISGCADGADDAGLEWAELNRIPVARFEVTRREWKEQGRSAGPKRNQGMLDEGLPDVAVEFPGGAGTADMRRRLDWKGVVVYEPCVALAGAVG